MFDEWIAALVFGSAAMAALLRDALNWAAWSAMAVTVASAINLVIRSSERARLHYDLVRRFLALEEKVLPAKMDQFSGLYAEKLKIEAEEPPPLQVLAAICHNDQLQAEGIDGVRKVRLRWWQRLFAHVLDLPPTPAAPPTST